MPCATDLMAMAMQAMDEPSIATHGHPLDSLLLSQIDRKPAPAIS